MPKAILCALFVGAAVAAIGRGSYGVAHKLQNPVRDYEVPILGGFMMPMPQPKIDEPVPLGDMFFFYGEAHPVVFVHPSGLLTFGAPSTLVEGSYLNSAENVGNVPFLSFLGVPLQPFNTAELDFGSLMTKKELTPEEEASLENRFYFGFMNDCRYTAKENILADEHILHDVDRACTILRFYKVKTVNENGNSDTIDVQIILTTMGNYHVSYFDSSARNAFIGAWNFDPAFDSVPAELVSIKDKETPVDLTKESFGSINTFLNDTVNLSFAYVSLAVMIVVGVVALVVLVPVSVWVFNSLLVVKMAKRIRRIAALEQYSAEQEKSVVKGKKML